MAQLDNRQQPDGAGTRQTAASGTLHASRAPAMTLGDDPARWTPVDRIVLGLEQQSISLARLTYDPRNGRWQRHTGWHDQSKGNLLPELAPAFRGRRVHLGCDKIERMTSQKAHTTGIFRHGHRTEQRTIPVTTSLSYHHTEQWDSVNKRLYVRPVHWSPMREA